MKFLLCFYFIISVSFTLSSVILKFFCIYYKCFVFLKILYTQFTACIFTNQQLFSVINLFYWNFDDPREEIKLDDNANEESILLVPDNNSAENNIEASKALLLKKP